MRYPTLTPERLTRVMDFTVLVSFLSFYLVPLFNVHNVNAFHYMNHKFHPITRTPDPGAMHFTNHTAHLSTRTPDPGGMNFMSHTAHTSTRTPALNFTILVETLLLIVIICTVCVHDFLFHKMGFKIASQFKVFSPLRRSQRSRDHEIHNFSFPYPQRSRIPK